MSPVQESPKVITLAQESPKVITLSNQEGSTEGVQERFFEDRDLLYFGPELLEPNPDSPSCFMVVDNNDMSGS